MNRASTVLTTVSIALMLFPLSVAGVGQTTTPRAHDPNRLEAVTIVVRPGGFPLKVIRLPYGLYSLGILNRSGVDDLALELDRMPGTSLEGAPVERAGSGALTARKARWLQRVVLSPGTYRLRVVGRSTWVCSIEVK